MMTLQNITLTSLKQIAEALSKHLYPGICICLWGDLGAGKSTFSRMIIQTLNPDITDVPSPTFTLLQHYETPLSEVWHCDLYRLHHPEEIIELGLEDALGQAITLIEWPEKMGWYLPADRLDIHLTLSPDEKRTLSLQCQGAVELDLKTILKDSPP
jgi:tRNA threonylcarbamoyl adenosine modification protein YjeE